jgi:hypothetical protein
VPGDHYSALTTAEFSKTVVEVARGTQQDGSANSA